MKIKILLILATLYSTSSMSATTTCKNLFALQLQYKSVKFLPANVEVFSENKAKMDIVGIPPFMNKNFPYFETTQYLASVWGDHGSGVHIGNGIILTNRHVYTELTRLKANFGAFNGFEKIEYGPENRELHLVQLPKPSAADVEAFNYMPGYMRGLRWDRIDKYNDWAILYDAQLQNKAALSDLREASQVEVGETLWILGRHEQSPKAYIAAGTFEKNKGKISIIDDIDLMGGFSGSPVVDGRGQIVGLIFAFNPALRKATMINIESILKDLKPPKIKTKEQVIENAKPNVVVGPAAQAVQLNYQFINNNKKETVIFLNGNGDNLDSFSQVQSMMSKNFNYLRYDQRGQGQTFYQGVDFKIASMVADLQFLIQQLGLQKVNLVGHSFGARIAMAYAATHPQEVKSIVVEDMDFIARDPNGEQGVDQYAYQFLAIQKTYPSFDSMIQAIERVYGSDPQVLTQILEQSYFRQEAGQSVTLISTPYQSYLWGSYANAVDLGAAFRSYTGPVIFLRADPQASGLTEQGLKQIRSIRPQVQVLNFPGSSHNIHQSMPTQYVNVVSKFLQTLP